MSAGFYNLRTYFSIAGGNLCMTCTPRPSLEGDPKKGESILLQRVEPGLCRQYGRAGAGRMGSGRIRINQLHKPFGAVGTEITEGGQRVLERHSVVTLAVNQAHGDGRGPVVEIVLLNPGFQSNLAAPLEIGQELPLKQCGNFGRERRIDLAGKFMGPVEQGIHFGCENRHEYLVEHVQGVYPVIGPEGECDETRAGVADAAEDVEQ